MAFVHLHFHTSYSFLDGYNPINRAVARVKELGMNAVAITDHNHLAGIPKFVEECQNNGIKPILGLEGYYNTSMAETAKPSEERRKDAERKALEAGAITQEQIDQAYSKKKKTGWITKRDLNALTDPFAHNTDQYHILYLAKNQTGWNNLIKLQSESARLCTYNGRYIADMDLIRKYHEGIICTNACIGSYSAEMINIGEFQKAEQYIIDMKDIFGEDFYLEIQPLMDVKQARVNYFYMAMAKKHNIKVIATNDVHYTLESDYDDHDTYVCIGFGQYKTEEAARRAWEKDQAKAKKNAKKKETDNAEAEKEEKKEKTFTYRRVRYPNELWIRSEEEMDLAFRRQMEAYDILTTVNSETYERFFMQAMANTQLIADSVSENILIGSKTPLFPKVKVPFGLTPEKYLEINAYKGLYKYLKEHPECDKEVYKKRLREELDIINPKGFAPYMLTVKEYANWADRNFCPVGPGRGSAAGSLVLFCTGITKNIDPIKYNLWFSRFLTADRKDPPDCYLIA